MASDWFCLSADAAESSRSSHSGKSEARRWHSPPHMSRSVTSSLGMLTGLREEVDADLKCYMTISTNATTRHNHFKHLPLASFSNQRAQFFLASWLSGSWDPRPHLAGVRLVEPSELLKELEEGVRFITGVVLPLASPRDRELPPKAQERHSFSRRIWWSGFHKKKVQMTALGHATRICPAKNFQSSTL